MELETMGCVITEAMIENLENLREHLGCRSPIRAGQRRTPHASHSIEGKVLTLPGWLVTLDAQPGFG